MMRVSKAQSILEYIIVLSAITLAVLAASNEGGPIRKAVDKMFTDSGDLIEAKTDLFLKNAASNGGSGGEQK